MKIWTNRPTFTSTEERKYVSIYVTKETLFHAGDAHWKRVGLDWSKGMIMFDEEENRKASVTFTIWAIPKEYSRANLGRTPKKVIKQAMKLVRRSIHGLELSVRFETSHARKQLSATRLSHQKEVLEALTLYLETISTPDSQAMPVLKDEKRFTHWKELLSS